MNVSLKTRTIVAVLAASLIASLATVATACPRGGRGGGYRGASRARLPLPGYGQRSSKPSTQRRPEREIVVVPPQARPIVDVEPKPATKASAPATQPMPDLQFVELRLVDAGDALLELGPTFRLVVKNAGSADIAAPFQVTLTVADQDARSADAARATEEVSALAAGEAQTVSVSLPYTSAFAADNGRVRVQIDSQRDVSEMDEENNVANVDPRHVERLGPQLSTALPSAPHAGEELVLEGESLGETAGRVFVTLGGIKLEADVIDWLPSRVTVKLPQAVLEKPSASQIVVHRADGAKAAAINLDIHPSADSAGSLAAR